MIKRRTFLWALGSTALTATGAFPQSSRDEVLRGFNLIETTSAPFGSQAAALSIAQLRKTGATAATVIPFLWQPAPTSSGIVMGDALPHDRIAAGIAQLHAAGLAAIVKPHVWVPESWAGAIAPAAGTENDWQAAYENSLRAIAVTAEQSRAEVLVLGTELRGVSGAEAWEGTIAGLREAFSGKITYVAHGADEAEKVAFWPLLDAVAVSLYPVLGAAGATADWDRAIAKELDRVEAVARKHAKPIWIAEIGIRSAEGATERPWESAEERAAPADMALQAGAGSPTRKAAARKTLISPCKTSWRRRLSQIFGARGEPEVPAMLSAFTGQARPHLNAEQKHKSKGRAEQEHGFDHQNDAVAGFDLHDLRQTGFHPQGRDGVDQAPPG